ncbi:hypothetical protein F5Y07DRAFT_400794 [Xylaria sp. FL0933]|nr:hypothetical protein F5Y07DRAFT_400794 [Xylaria sp. FL0933]
MDPSGSMGPGVDAPPPYDYSTFHRDRSAREPGRSPSDVERAFACVMGFLVLCGFVFVIHGLLSPPKCLRPWDPCI